MTKESSTHPRHERNGVVVNTPIHFGIDKSIQAFTRYQGTRSIHGCCLSKSNHIRIQICQLQCSNGRNGASLRVPRQDDTFVRIGASFGALASGGFEFRLIVGKVSFVKARLRRTTIRAQHTLLANLFGAQFQVLFPVFPSHCRSTKGNKTIAISLGHEGLVGF